jgi:hypothetical protein
MATQKSSAPNVHPSTEEHNHQDERPHACIDGWVYVGYLDDNDVERVASYRCRRCG